MRRVCARVVTLSSSSSLLSAASWPRAACLCAARHHARTPSSRTRASRRQQTAATTAQDGTRNNSNDSSSSSSNSSSSVDKKNKEQGATSEGDDAVTAAVTAAYFNDISKGRKTIVPRYLQIASVLAKQEVEWAKKLKSNSSSSSSSSSSNNNDESKDNNNNNKDSVRSVRSDSINIHKSSPQRGRHDGGDGGTAKVVLHARVLPTQFDEDDDVDNNDVVGGGGKRRTLTGTSNSSSSSNSSSTSSLLVAHGSKGQRDVAGKRIVGNEPGIAFDDSLSEELFGVLKVDKDDDSSSNSSNALSSSPLSSGGNGKDTTDDRVRNTAAARAAVAATTTTTRAQAVPSLDAESAEEMAYDFMDEYGHSLTRDGAVASASAAGGGDGSVRTQSLSLQQHSASATGTATQSYSQHDERVLACVDMLCDDLYYCKTEVLRNFARTRGVTAANKAEMVLRLITVAHRDAHGANKDLAVTRRVFGDVFHESVRTSGLRRAWTNKSLEASHMEQAAMRHLSFEQMANSNKTLSVRRHAAEAARVLRRLSRPFQQEYGKLATAAVGGVFRVYKSEADRLVHTLPVSELVSPYAALLVSHARFAQTVTLLTRANVADMLVQQLQVVQPSTSIVAATAPLQTNGGGGGGYNNSSNSNNGGSDADDGSGNTSAAAMGSEHDSEYAALQRLMELIDGVVAEVERREACYAAPSCSARSRGRDTGASLVCEVVAFAQESHSSWLVDAAPAWVHDLARMFSHWEAVVRADLASSFGDVPRYVFDVILHGVVRVYTLQRLYGNDTISLTSDVPSALRAALRVALERHYGGDVARAADALRELVAYAMGGGGMMRSSKGSLISGERTAGVVRGEFLAAVLSQMTGAAVGSGSGGSGLATSSDGNSSNSSSELHRERVAVVLREVSATASSCTRVYSLPALLVRLTEDLRFHLRFAAVYRRLGGVDRKTVRLRSCNVMHRTLQYFESEFAVTPLSIKAVAFLVVLLTHIACRTGTSSNNSSSSSSGGGHGESGRRPVLERFASVTGRAELDVVALSESGAIDPRDLRVAFPPQLSYHSWLNESDTRAKSVYNVLPSVAVKGSANQAMLVSQAPMMQALDAISRVPWRINRYMLHVQEAIVREGFGFGKIRPAFYPLHYVALSRGDVDFAAQRAGAGAAADKSSSSSNNDVSDVNGDVDGVSGGDAPLLFNLTQRSSYEMQQSADWKSLSELRSNRIHYLQALRQARSMVQFSHLYFPNSMDFRGRMYPLPGRLNHTGSDPFRALLEYAEPKLLGRVGLYWLKVHLANKFGMTKLSFDERVHFVDEHISDVVQSAEAPLHGDRWWQEASEPLQCLMACKELTDALKCSQGVEHYASRLPVAVDGSYNGLQHYSAIGRDAYGAALVNLVPSARPADAYTGILNEMLKAITTDAARDHPVAQRCLGTGRGQDKDHIKRKTIKRPIMTQVYGVTNFGMSEQIFNELEKQNKSHGLWTRTDMREMSVYLREQVLESLGVTFRETQNCRRWISTVAQLVWAAQPAELHNALCWTTPLGLVVRQPYKVRKECSFFTTDGYTRIPGDAVAPASRKQLTAMAPNLIHSLDATHLAMTALEMQRRGLSMMAVHDSYWTYACDLPTLSQVLRQQFVDLYSRYDPLWELKEQWEEAFFYDLRRHGVKLPDPPQRGDLDLSVVLHSPYFFS